MQNPHVLRVRTELVGTEKASNLHDLLHVRPVNWNAALRCLYAALPHFIFSQRLLNHTRVHESIKT